MKHLKTITTALVAILFSISFVGLTIGSDEVQAADPTIIDSGATTPWGGEWTLYSNGLLLIDMQGYDLTLGFIAGADDFSGHALDVTAIRIINSELTGSPSGDYIELALFNGFTNVTSFAYHHAIGMLSIYYLTPGNFDSVRTVEVVDTQSPSFGVLFPVRWFLGEPASDLIAIGPVETFIVDTSLAFYPNWDFIPPAQGKTLIFTEKATNLSFNEYNDPIFYIYVDGELVKLTDPADLAGRAFEAGIGNTWVEIANLSPEPTPDTDNGYTLLILAIIAVLAFTILAYFGFGYIGSIVSFILGALAVLILFLCGVIK